MEIRFELNAITKIIEEIEKIEGVVHAPAFRNDFVNLQEMQEYNKAVKRYIQYCKNNNIPMVSLYPCP